jgi:agmatinase
MLYLRKTFSYEYPLEEARVCLFGVPWDGTETGMPVRSGPLFLREAIRNLPGFDHRSGMNPFGSMKLTDLGDVETVPGSWKLTRDAIEDTVDHMLKTNPETIQVFLGGEHLITLPIIEKLAEFHRGLTVVQLDAHRDLMPEWMGNPLSHITWAHHALRNKDIKLVQLGARSWNKEEEQLIGNVKETLDGLEGPVYLTVDLDVLDPSHAPEVGTPEPGGMEPRELFSVIRKVSGIELAGMDIVECASQAVGTRTALLGAHAFREMLLGLMAKELPVRKGDVK